MSFALTLCDCIAIKIDTLVVDTNLFHGGDFYDSPDSCVVIDEIAGGSESESGMIRGPIQVIAKALSYEAASALIHSVYDVLANKPGLSDIDESIHYSGVLQRPFLVEIDERKRYVFVATFLIARTQ